MRFDSVIVGRSDGLEMMVSDAIKMTKEIKEKIGVKNAATLRKGKSIMDRIEDVEVYKSNELALMYNDLAPEDIKKPINTSMMRNFLENVIKKDNPDAYEKIWKYYNLSEVLPEKYMKKLAIFIEKVWSQYRTIEYCYQYSKSFHDFVEKYAKKVDAEGMSNLDKIKWFRLWLFVIKDQGFYWFDIRKDGKFSFSEQNENLYLFPETIVYFDYYVSEIPDNSINVEMMKRLIELYPEEVQNKVWRFAELNNNNVPDMLRTGEIREKVKKALFPISWMSEPMLFCMNDCIKKNDPEYLKAAVIAYQNGGIKTLKSFKQKGNDPFDRFRLKSVDCYEVFSAGEKDGKERVFSVTSSEELAMFVEVYKWLLEHSDIKFGPENKTLSEYGIETLLDEEPEINSDWFLQMNLVDTDEDINWDLFDKIVERNDKFMSMYLKKEISAEDLYKELGFSTALQAKLCCNKTVKLVESEATRMAAALKRIKMFGTSQAIRSDLIYLEIFKYMLSEKPENLPKNMVNLYGKVFK